MQQRTRGAATGRSTHGDATDAVDPADAVLRAVATERGVDPLALPRLYDAVESDALADLVDSLPDGGDARVEFSYADCRVAVRADGTVAVERASPDGE